jgi:hypothetical protein
MNAETFYKRVQKRRYCRKCHKAHARKYSLKVKK